MKSLKMQSLYRCKKRTSQYGAANYPFLFSCKYRAEISGNLTKFGASFRLRYRICTNDNNIYQKEADGNGEVKNPFLVSVQKRALSQFGAANYPVSCSDE